MVLAPYLTVTDTSPAPADGELQIMVLLVTLRVVIVGGVGVSTLATKGHRGKYEVGYEHRHGSCGSSKKALIA
jgi:hypothetical protein